MPKKEPTATQELTARYLAAGAGFKPEEQFFALLNAASQVNRIKPLEDRRGMLLKFIRSLKYALMEPLADNKAPF